MLVCTTERGVWLADHSRHPIEVCEALGLHYPFVGLETIDGLVIEVAAHALRSSDCERGATFLEQCSEMNDGTRLNFECDI